MYELTQHGKDATKERLAAWPEVLLVPLRDPALVVREATKELPAAPAGLLDRDADAERRIAGYIGALLAGLLARAFPWLSRAAIWSLLRAHDFAPREQ